MITDKKWYAKSLDNKADQALIIDEDTGRDVAVVYDQKDAGLLAATPDLARVVQRFMGIRHPNSGKWTKEETERSLKALERDAIDALRDAGLEWWP